MILVTVSIALFMEIITLFLAVLFGVPILLTLGCQIILILLGLGYGVSHTSLKVPYDFFLLMVAGIMIAILFAQLGHWIPSLNLSYDDYFVLNMGASFGFILGWALVSLRHRLTLAQYTRAFLPTEKESKQ